MPFNFRYLIAEDLIPRGTRLTGVLRTCYQLQKAYKTRAIKSTRYLSAEDWLARGARVKKC